MLRRHPALRLIRLLTALLLAVTVAGAAADAASARSGNAGPDHCKEVGIQVPLAGEEGASHPPAVHLKLCWDDMALGGIKLTDVQERVDPGYWESTAFKCAALYVWNDNDVLKFVQTGAHCDIPKNLGYRVFDNLSIKMPGTRSVTAELIGRAQVNLDPDKAIDFKLTIP